MKLITFILSLCLFAATIHANTWEPTSYLLPQPQSFEKASGYISPSKITHILIPENYDLVLPLLLYRLKQVPSTGIGIDMQITNIDVPNHPEGYTIRISKNSIQLSSKTPEGLFYATQTLSQLMQDALDYNQPLPCLKITDYPNLDFRAIHIDTKHHLDRMQYYYELMDRLSAYKINHIIWELEDKLRYTSHPEIAANNAISKQEMQALCRYAKERNIRIHPLVQGLGHAPYILKHHWNLREDTKSDWEFCPSNPKTYDMLFDLYQEAMDAMPYSQYLHIGGDEISAIGICNRCKATSKSAFELQMEWLAKVCDYAISHGKTPIFWDDMPLKHADLWWLLHKPLTLAEMQSNWNTDKLDAAFELFPKNCIFMRWEYNDPNKWSHKQVLQWYKNKGIQVYAATSASSGETPYMPRLFSRVPYIKDFCKLSYDNNFQGILSTAWGDVATHYELVMRGFLALGAYAWNVNANTTEDYLTAHALREWGLSRNDVSFIDDMEQTVAFFDTALVVAGVRNPAYEVDGIFTLIDLPSSNPGEWTKKYQSKLSSAKIEDLRCKKVANNIKQIKPYAIRNKYALDIYEITNQLFHYPIQLLLALEAYDNASPTDKPHAKETLHSLCLSFYTLKTNLLNIYSKTRFMSQPEGYIEDLNHHHHLSAHTFNSDWIFYFEQPFTQQLLQWLDKIP